MYGLNSTDGSRFSQDAHQSITCEIIVTISTNYEQINWKGRQSGKTSFKAFEWSEKQTTKKFSPRSNVHHDIRWFRKGFIIRWWSYAQPILRLLSIVESCQIQKNRIVHRMKYYCPSKYWLLYRKSNPNIYKNSLSHKNERKLQSNVYWSIRRRYRKLFGNKRLVLIEFQCFLLMLSLLSV